MDTALLLPLTKRNRLLSVEHVQLIPPYDKEGRHTSIDSFFALMKLNVQALNRAKSAVCPASAVSPNIRPITPPEALSAALAKTMLRGPASKLARFCRSITKVGLSSCSRSSMTLTCWRSRNAGVSGRLSGLRIVPANSKDAQLPGVLADRAGLPTIWPFGSLTVVTVLWESPPIMEATASDADQLGGRPSGCLDDME